MTGRSHFPADRFRAELHAGQVGPPEAGAVDGSRSTAPEVLAVTDPPRRRTWLRALQDLFALKGADLPVLVLLAPLFGTVTAATVVVATFSKSVFLDVHERSALPWMFLGSSLFTVLVSIGYVAVIEQVSLLRRFRGLLGLSIVSFSALTFAFPLHPKAVALAQFVWTSGIGNLLLAQTWNMTSALLPARQGKRLFPVLAAVSTLGAAAGGWGVSLLLRVVEAHHLMWLVVALLTVVLVRIRYVVDALARLDLGDDPGTPTSAGDKAAGGEVMRGFRSIRDTPLLFRLAALVFLLQIASLLIDFQFSSELKSRYSRAQMAGFLGTYYGIANLVAFFVALLATGRIVRVVGIGMSISASAVAVGLGSGAYYLASVTGATWGFWAIVATSFAERIGQFALSRNAMQMLVMPLETRKGERAKTLIDGVVYRVATALVSLALLALAGSWSLGAFAPAAVLACIGAVGIGLSMGPHYRSALFEGLRARRLDTDGDPQTRELLVRAALREVRSRLQKGDPREVVQALAMIKEMALPVTADDLMPVAQLTDPELARRALECMNDLRLQPDRDALVAILRPDQPAGVLREGLRLLSAWSDPALTEVVAPFVQHADAGVARLALVWLKAAGSEVHTATIDAQLKTDLRSQQADRRARAAFISGGYSLDATHDLAAMLDDPSPEVRKSAVESMGQIGSAEFVEPLMRALSRSDLVPAASAALGRYGAGVVQQAQRLFDGHGRTAGKPLGVAMQLRLLRVVERAGTAEAMLLLMGQVESAVGLVRDNAVLALWRLARDPDKPRPPRAWTEARLRSELAQLQRYQAIEQLALGQSPRHAFFRSELTALRTQAEGRAFRLLGLVYNRAAMHKAFLYYRSPQARVRSTAIELLDQHVLDPGLKSFVALVERVETPVGRSTGLDDGDALSYTRTPQALAEALAQVEPWLGRVWAWAQAGKAGAAGKMSRDPMDLVFLLKSVPLLSDLSGEQLLPVADAVRTVHIEAGDLVFAEGDPGDHLYVIVEGEVDVLRSGEQVATLGEKECFGDMALLDQSPRSAGVRARRNLELLVLAREDFQDLLDLHPALARGVIRVLTQRLRNATEAVAEEKEERHG
jgi:hypothetical protein